jgi:drug/metabolite transporter (DMT)-like permease
MFVWWSPLGFLGPWQKLVGISSETLKRRMGVGTAFSIAGSLVIAIVLKAGIEGTQLRTAWAGAGLGLGAGIGFVVPALLSPVVFEGKSFRLFLINAGFQVLALVGMAACLGAFSAGA